jgi:hypothetical protein
MARVRAAESGPDSQTVAGAVDSFGLPAYQSSRCDGLCGMHRAPCEVLQERHQTNGSRPIIWWSYDSHCD